MDMVPAKIPSVIKKKKKRKYSPEMLEFRVFSHTLGLPEYLRKIIMAAANGNPLFREQYQLARKLEEQAVIFVAEKLAWFTKKQSEIIIQAIRAGPFFRHTECLSDEMDMRYLVFKGVSQCVGEADYILSAHVWNRGKKSPTEERIIKILYHLRDGESMLQSKIHKKIRAQHKAEKIANPKYLEEILTAMSLQGKIEFTINEHGVKRYFIVF